MDFLQLFSCLQSCYAYNKASQQKIYMKEKYARNLGAVG